MYTASGMEIFEFVSEDKKKVITKITVRYCCYICLICSFLFFVSLVVLCCFNLFLFCKSKIFSLIFILCVFWRGAVQYLPSYQEKYHMETNLYVTLSWQLEVPSHPPQVTSNWNNDEGLYRE